MTLDLEIVAPDDVVVQTRAQSVQAADATGRFGLFPGHERFVTLLTPSLLVFRDEDGRERYAAVDGGVLLLEGRRISVVTREAVVADHLDELTAKAQAILDARQRQERQAQTEFAELQIALARELRQRGRER
jgi:F-type H+-transporting ATPase subunit epsilon